MREQEPDVIELVVASGFEEVRRAALLAGVGIGAVGEKEAGVVLAGPAEGRMPPAIVEVGSAPCASSNSTISGWLSLAAKRRGSPRTGRFGFAPCSRRRRSEATSFFSKASRKADAPSSKRKAPAARAMRSARGLSNWTAWTRAEECRVVSQRGIAKRKRLTTAS
jgi:hypothetical protein